MKKLSLLVTLLLTISLTTQVQAMNPKDAEMLGYIGEQVRSGLRPFLNEKNYNNLVLKFAGAGIMAGALSALFFPGISGLIDTKKPKNDASVFSESEIKKMEAKRLDSRRKAWMKLGVGSVFALAGSLIFRKSSSLNDWMHSQPMP